MRMRALGHSMMAANAGYGVNTGYGVLLHYFWFPADFFLMGIHVQPSNAAVEIEALAPAYGQATEHYSSSRGVILGDMNAGCR